MCRSTKAESGTSRNNTDAHGDNTYDKPWTIEDDRRYSAMTVLTVYDHIDESRAGYAELKSVKPKKQATSGDDAPEPPPARPHVYLELFDVS